jgi:single-strand DNA-binding protein
MAYINRVQVLGVATKDAVLSKTTAGIPMASFTIQVMWKEERRDTFYVVCWGKCAEFVGNTVKQGQSLLVEGRLSSRKWMTDGVPERDVVEVVAEKVLTVESNKYTPKTQDERLEELF